MLSPDRTELKFKLPPSNRQTDHLKEPKQTPEEIKRRIEQLRHDYRIASLRSGATFVSEDIPYSTFNLTTANAGNWRILIDQRALITKGNLAYDPPLNGHPDFTHMQDFSMFKCKQTPEDLKKFHDENTHLFAENWSILSSILYPGLTFTPYNLRRFSEVNVEGAGHMDFMGIGPDNRIIIVEFGKGELIEPSSFVYGHGKSKQVRNFAKKTQDLFSREEKRGKQRTITPLVGYYASDFYNNHFLTIHPPRIDNNGHVEIFDAAKHH